PCRSSSSRPTVPRHSWALPLPSRRSGARSLHGAQSGLPRQQVDAASQLEPARDGIVAPSPTERRLGGGRRPAELSCLVAGEPIPSPQSHPPQQRNGDVP